MIEISFLEKIPAHESSNVHASAKKVRWRTNSRRVLHYNHPLFDRRSHLCFELGQQSLNRSEESDYIRSVS
jgi:hypothetical protein